MTYTWSTFSGKSFDLAGFAAYVATLKWVAWKPVGIVFHNTGSPTLAQWVELGPAHDQRILNLKHQYQDLDNWHAGPHIFSGRAHCTEFTSLLVSGVHASRFNATHFGIEMPGDYSTEFFTTGDGALVRDNTVAIGALLYHALGIDPRAPGALHFHKDCAADHHACPGVNVDRADFLACIVAKLPGQ